MGSPSPRTWFRIALIALAVMGVVARNAHHDTPVVLEPDRARPVPGELRLALRATRTADSGTLHRLGGEPDLPADVPWPSRNGAPMAFIAQIDLADAARVAPSSGLPHEGVLSFFYDAESQPWGFDPADRDSHRVIWSHGAELALRPAPPELGAGSRFAPVAFSVVRFDDPPSPVMLEDVDEYLDANDAREALFLSPPDALDLKVLGNPNPIQDEMELEVQLASNGIYMGDLDGRQDARAARFDRTWVVLQCG